MKRNCLDILSITVLTLLSCHSKINPADSGIAPEKILFVAYEVTRDSVSQKVATKILYQKTTDGQIKPGSIENAGNEAGNWQISLLDKKNNLVDRITVENPLHKKLEYVLADGTMGIKEVWLSRAELAFRFNYKKEMTKVLITEIDPDKNNHTIFNHSILLADQ
ncbi:MAG TPA: hypothetical protein VGO58_00750 [Chitinophagaceae bacterium]|jgi:hypothetical protein|nr:hypothetical protein [Chitinophagaceae bacterium]